MTVPCPGDVLRFWVSYAAAHQLSFIQTHEPVSWSAGDFGIWGVLTQKHRHEHAVIQNIHLYSASKTLHFKAFYKQRRNWLML